MFGADAGSPAAVSHVERPFVALLKCAAPFETCDVAFGSLAEAPRGLEKWVGQLPRGGQGPSFCGGDGVSMVAAC